MLWWGKGRVMRLWLGLSTLAWASKYRPSGYCQSRGERCAKRVDIDTDFSNSFFFARWTAFQFYGKSRIHVIHQQAALPLAMCPTHHCTRVHVCVERCVAMDHTHGPADIHIVAESSHGYSVMPRAIPGHICIPTSALHCCRGYCVDNKVHFSRQVGARGSDDFSVDDSMCSVFCWQK